MHPPVCKTTGMNTWITFIFARLSLKVISNRLFHVFQGFSNTHTHLPEKPEGKKQAWIPQEEIPGMESRDLHMDLGACEGWEPWLHIQKNSGIREHPNPPLLPQESGGL